MNTIALAGIILAGAIVGGMSELRKLYQIRNGAGASSALFFVFVSSVVAFISGLFTGADIQLEKYSFLLSFSYAIVNTVLAYICVVGTAYGNMTILITCCSLGSLVIPSIYGIIVNPEVNRITVMTAIGYIFALSSMIPTMFQSKGEKGEKASLRFKILCGVAFVFQGLPLIIFSLKKDLCSWCTDYSFVTEYMILSAILTLVLIMVNCLKNRTDTKEVTKCIEFKSISFMLVYGIIFIISEVISLICVGKVPLIIQSPLSFAVPIAVTAFFDYIIHHEKLNKYQLCQVICAVMSCIFFVIG